MINMALKWHHKNISNKIIIFIEFWWSLDMFFSLFDCDYTHVGVVMVAHNTYLTKHIVLWANQKVHSLYLMWGWDEIQCLFTHVKACEN